MFPIPLSLCQYLDIFLHGSIRTSELGAEVVEGGALVCTKRKTEETVIVVPMAIKLMNLWDSSLL